MTTLLNPFELPGNWYKANLHTHTTTSDGQMTPQEALDAYYDKRYDILALTDHYTTHDVTDMQRDGFLVISGTEYHPPCPTVDNAYHIVGLNVPYGLDLNEIQDANEAIAKVAASGGESSLAHPHWTGQSFQDFRNLKGLRAMEVWNSTCSNFDRGYSENEWTNALDRGMILPPIAVDDVHFPTKVEIFGGWTWFKMPELTTECFMEAFRTGAFYPSRGPQIEYFGVKDDKLTIKCSPVDKITFLGQTCCNGSWLVAEDGETLTEYSIDAPDGEIWKYMRASVTDANGMRAWTPPIIL